MEIIKEQPQDTSISEKRNLLRNIDLSNLSSRSGQRSRPKMQISRTASTFETSILKVAAYARVSTAQEEQEESYESQKEFYEAYIKSNPRWEFVGIYADQGLTGTESQHRIQFQQMIADAKAGKINIILVKSISRFARNAVEAQNYLHELRQYNVEVRFDKEQLSSFDGNTEMALNMMALVAELESRTTSENTRWTLQRLAEQGIRKVGNRIFGYEEVDGVLNPDENAWAVKLIYEEFANGMLPGEIIDLLKKRRKNTNGQR